MKTQFLSITRNKKKVCPLFGIMCYRCKKTGDRELRQIELLVAFAVENLGRRLFKPNKGCNGMMNSHADARH
jgi:hypothetical protein